MKFYTTCTRGSPYCYWVGTLQESARAFGFEVECLWYESTGDWLTNNVQRAVLLHEAAQAHPFDGVCLLDADLRFSKNPALLRVMGDDVALFDRGPSRAENDRYAGGLVAFGASKAGRTMLFAWAKLSQEDMDKKTPWRDQLYLCRAVTPLLSGSSASRLPARYCRRHDAVRTGDDTVIVHWAASQFHKHDVTTRKEKPENALDARDEAR